MTQRIVVGVDGSTHSVVALRHAIEEARRRDAELDVVYAYRVPTLGAAAMYGMTVPAWSREDAERDALAVVDRTIGLAPADVDIERIAVPGPSLPPGCWARWRGPTCWWSARVVGAASPACCWGRPASACCVARRVPCWWCHEHPTPNRTRGLATVPSIGHVLVAVDGSEHAEHALAVAAELAGSRDAKVTFLHVVPRQLQG